MNGLTVLIIATAGVFVGWLCTFAPFRTHLRAEQRRRTDAERAREHAHREEVGRLQVELGVQQSHVNTLRARIATLESQLQTQQSHHATLLTDDRLALLAAAQAQAASMEQRIDQLRSALHQAQRQLAEPAESSLNEDDHASGGDVELIADLTTDEATFSPEQATSDARAMLQARLDACQRALTQARQESAQVIAHFQARIASLSEQLAAARESLSQREEARGALQAEQPSELPRAGAGEPSAAQPAHSRRQPRFTEENLPPTKAEAMQAALRWGARATLSSCPQPLSRVRAIGAAFSRRLYEEGIGTYWEVATLSDDALARILRLNETQRQRYNLAEMREDARRLAEETQSVGRVWDGTPPDDLTLLEGIGESYQRRLYEAGICTFDALANASPELLQAICPPNRLSQPDYAHWIAQARARVAQA